MNRTVKSVHESKTPQTIRTSQTGSLYLTVISTPSAEKREEVSRHLRYWPYVKLYKYQGDRHLLCCFCLGEVKDGYQLKQLYERSRQLVLLCLRQYGVTITRWKALPEDFKLYHNNRLFTRPDDTLKPFITFMGDVETEDSSKGTSGATIIQHPASVNRQQVNRASILNWIKTLLPSFPKFSSFRT
jgi:hypothetical protein